MALRLEEFRRAQETARAAGSTAFPKPRPPEAIRAPAPPAPPPALPQNTASPALAAPPPQQPQQAFAPPQVAPPVDPQQEAAGFLDQLFPGGQPGAGGRAPLIDFKKNPLEAIGLLLSNVSAGLDGRPSPVAALRAQRAQQDQNRFKNFGDSMKLLVQANDISQNASPETRQKLFAQLNEYSQQLMGVDMGPAIEAMTEKHGAQLDDLLNITGDADVSAILMRIAGSAAGAIDLAAEPKYKQLMEDFLENKYLPSALDKLEYLSTIIEDRLPGALEDGTQWSDFLQLNRLIDDPEVQFNEQELGVVRRKLDNDPDFRESLKIQPDADLQAERLRLKEASEEIVKFGNVVTDRDGNFLFEVPKAEDGKASFSGAEFKAAVAMQADGIELGGAFSDEITETVEKMTKEEARRISRTLGTTGTVFPLTKEEKQAKLETSKDFSTASAAIGQLSAALLTINRAGEDGKTLSGVPGVLASNIGGILGQFGKGGQELEKAFVGIVTNGAKSGEVKAWQVQARAIIAANISTLAGEESGRFSEQERIITETSAALLDPLASPTQIKAALGELIILKMMVRDLTRIRARVDAKYDLSTPEGGQDFLAKMERMGMAEEQMINAFNQVRLLRESIRQ